jgi:hypothetical protein
MLKQQSLYNPAGGWQAICLSGNKRAWAGQKYTSAFSFTGIPGRPVFLCIILFMVSLFAGFSTVRAGAMLHENDVACTPVAANPAGQDAPFSFEYSGLFHLKVVISTDAFFISDIDIN